MINLLYLGLAVLVSVVASVIVMMRNRKPTSMESGMEEFARGLRALAPEPTPGRGRRGRGGRSG